MIQLFVGVGRVQLHLRHAQTLKDKRQILMSLNQRLKNLGFSVCETGDLDNPKYGTLGFSLVNGDRIVVEDQFNKALLLFIGDFEVVDKQREVFDYSDFAFHDP